MELGQETIADLQQLGLSALGSRAYLALVERGEWVTGYEVAKVLGVARANVYDALRQLAQLGFAESQVNPQGTQYRAIRFERVADRQLKQLGARLERIRLALPERRPLPSVWQGSGWAAFRDQVDMVLQKAQSTVCIGTSVRPIQEVAKILDHHADQGALRSYGCWEGCPQGGCGVCRPPVASLPKWTSDPACLLIVDQRWAVGSWGSPEHPTVLATDYPAVVAGWQSLVTAPS
jgi:predicted transcriptional regulator